MKGKEASGGRTIKTLQFGELTFEDKHIFHFENGLLGFEELHDFVLISEEESLPFKWLLSVEKPEIGFPLLSPWHIDLNYNPGDNLNLKKLVIMSVITLEDEAGIMTANLKAPVVLDVENQKGEQVILPTDKYSPNHAITHKEKIEN
ncbi:MAG: flagellar assembly protein FliW [Bacteroidetes bacterium]|nr:flagellar assembly protein FliW [Bacteroidota bacterium]